MAFIALSSPSIAQQVAPEVAAPTAPACIPHKDVVASLKGEYNEGQAAIGLINNGNVFQLYSTKNGSSWTAFMTKPDGNSCLLFAGEHLDLIKTLEGIQISFPTEK